MPPVVRRRGEGEVEVLSRTAGVPLGVLPDASYESEAFKLTPGDAVLLYTDGLVEAMSPSRQMYGMDRLKRSVGRGASAATWLIERVVKDMQSHVADAPQFDDTTIVGIGLDVDRPRPS
jgi:serine phosphatase RsbU (regulator of sigma subunit)